jgi:hypothetical protein
MERSIALSTLPVAGFVAAGAEPASVVVYCQYVDYPVGCPVGAGVVLRPRQVARAMATPGVGAPGTPTDRGGPVDRVGRRGFTSASFQRRGSGDVEALSTAGVVPRKTLPEFELKRARRCSGATHEANQ